MFDWIWQGLARQWLAVTDAPFLYVAALSMLAGVIWLANRWYYDGTVASLKGAVALLERQRDEYREKLSGASPDEAKDTITQLRSDLETLQRRVGEREISSEVSQSVIAQLGSQPPHRVDIRFATGDTSSEKYADKLAAVLRQGGWLVNGPTAQYYFGAVWNLSVLVGERGDKEGARLLSEVFKTNGISIPVNTTKMDDDQFDLIVGTPSH